MTFLSVFITLLLIFIAIIFGPPFLVARYIRKAQEWTPDKRENDYMYNLLKDEYVIESESPSALELLLENSEEFVEISVIISAILIAIAVVAFVVSTFIWICSL